MATACVSSLFVGSIFTTSISPTAGVQISMCWGSQHLHCHPSPLPLLSAYLCSSHPLSALLSAVCAAPPLLFSCCISLPMQEPAHAYVHSSHAVMELNSLSCIVSLIKYNMQFTLIIFMPLCTHTCDQTTFGCNATSISLASLSTLI